MSEARRLRVAVVMGGPSTEHDVSINSGLQVLAHLDRGRYDVLPITITREGRWLSGSAPEQRSLESRPDGSAPAPSAEPAGADAPGAHGALDRLREEGRLDVVFLALHGAYGEDGCIQGLLRLAGVPFTGSGVLASALAMDKVKAKEIYAAHGIPVARQAVVHRRAWLAASADERRRLGAAALERAGLPCVVKPVVGGSSVATEIVREGASLEPAVSAALEVDERCLVEEHVAGTELTCGVLGGGPHEDAQALPLTEIVPVEGAFFDFRAKYTKGASREITPARVDAAATALVQSLAVKAHEALGCEGMSRTDFILRADGTPIALETNTIPGMTSTSLLPQAAAAAGLTFPALLDRLIASALLRGSGLARP